MLTTVGPYAKYGLPLVAACAAAGTDYADLTGEAMFMRESIDLHHKQAADTGARIVHSCGFDSIPSDLTVFALYRRIAEEDAGELADTTFVVRRMAGGFSGGTYASLMGVMRAMSSDAEVRRLLEDPLHPDTGSRRRAEFGRSRTCHGGVAERSRRSWTVYGRPDSSWDRSTPGCQA